MEIAPKAVGALQISENDLFANKLDFFSKPGKEVSMADSTLVAYKPAHLDDNGPYVFDIASQGNQFIDLNATRLLIKVKVTQDNISNTQIGEKNVAPINNFGCSFIDQIDIEFDGESVPELTNTDLGFKSYVETVLSYDSNSEHSHLLCQGFEMDALGEFEKFDYEDNTPLANVQKRSKWISTSDSFTTVSPLMSDFFQGDKFFPPGYKITLRMNRAKDDHLIKHKVKITPPAGAQDGTPITYKNFKIIVQDVKLFVRYISLTDQMTSKILEKIRLSDMHFPFTKNIVKKFTLPKDTNFHDVPYFVQGSLPRSVILTFRDHNAQNNKLKNPYYFRPFNLTYAALKVNGVSIPSIPYEPDWNTRTGFNRELRDFYDNIGVKNANISRIVTPEYYKDGLFFLAFDLSPDKCNGYHKHMKKAGTIDLELRFSNLTENIVVMGLLSYDAMLNFTPNKKFSIEY